MKNAIIPKRATPPATERPIIEPVPSPLLVLLLLLLSEPLVAVEDGDELVSEGGSVAVTITVLPAALVVSTVVGVKLDVDCVEVVEVVLAVVLVFEVEVVVDDEELVVVELVEEVVVEVLDVVVVDDVDVVDAVPGVVVESRGGMIARASWVAHVEWTRAKARKHERSNGLDPFMSMQNRFQATESCI